MRQPCRIGSELAKSGHSTIGNGQTISGPMLRDRLDDSNIVNAEKTTISLKLGGIEADHRMLDNSFFHVGGASYRGLISTRHYRRLMCDHVWETYLGGVAERLVNDL
ncbi:hypothetical protein [Mesorhizobium caraganae]|uniref:hypothetical protein n=1 Tax=Mesorhizobium caraganae TaxID=483206 RepID=UPI00177F8273|nr:hypothetical protein [Mesorhizobium caraganae]